MIPNMKTHELFEAVNDKLTGYLDISSLMKLLPDINNAENFETALTKLRLGQGADLTIPEKMQLALAFIGLLGLDGPSKSQVLRILMGFQAQPTAPPKSTGQIPGEPPPQTPNQQ
jgi:hypothetical protein